MRDEYVPIIQGPDGEPIYNPPPERDYAQAAGIIAEQLDIHAQSARQLGLHVLKQTQRVEELTNFVDRVARLTLASENKGTPDPDGESATLDYMIECARALQRKPENVGGEADA